MLALALCALRFRKGGFLDTSATLISSSAPAPASACPTTSGIRTTPPPKRLAPGLLQAPPTTYPGTRTVAQCSS
ncbi:hypothetical protein [Actinokineospora cianjurensis]|uniref:Uncharacterized protein n=1 Tax=Actinokineospora cianjurensis TaxID=585224 RepID=A0A421AVT0_9PSEU|nr:hypothetical protein [Actinokineospora cianjurensis]RLK54128.1 hypothetical protein CLV68_6130 [Actinokineospora cianjurensis]